MLLNQVLIVHTIRTDFSKSQSSNITNGDFPPSSNETFFKFDSEDAFIIVWPVAVLPVNPTFLISGCSAIALPVTVPSSILEVAKFRRFKNCLQITISYYQVPVKYLSHQLENRLQQIILQTLEQ